MIKINKGFTLVEVVISIFIIGVFLFAFVKTITSITSGVQLNKSKLTAVTHASNLMERIKALHWDDRVVYKKAWPYIVISPFSDDDHPIKGTRSVIGSDPGENTVTKYDDVDDYNGYSNTIGKYNLTVQVRYVDFDLSAGTFDKIQLAANGGLGAAREDRTDYKEITINVKWGNKQLQIKDIVSNVCF